MRLVHVRLRELAVALAVGAGCELLRHGEVLGDELLLGWPVCGRRRRCPVRQAALVGERLVRSGRLLMRPGLRFVWPAMLFMRPGLRMRGGLEMRGVESLGLEVMVGRVVELLVIDVAALERSVLMLSAFERSGLECPGLVLARRVRAFAGSGLVARGAVGLVHLIPPQGQVGHAAHWP